jgi:hypothetical protein
VKVSSLIRASAGGLALRGNDGKSIYYFGGIPTYTIIQKFDTETNYTSQLPAILPSTVMFASGVSNSNGIIFIYNGFTRKIIEFEEGSETMKIIADLPFQSSPVIATAAIPNGHEDGGIWIFAANKPRSTNPILWFSMVTKAVSIPTGNSTSQFPTLFETPSTVMDGCNGYIIGGLGKAMESDGSYHRTGGILR